MVNNKFCYYVDKHASIHNVQKVTVIGTNHFVNEPYVTEKMLHV